LPLTRSGAALHSERGNFVASRGKHRLISTNMAGKAAKQDMSDRRILNSWKEIAGYLGRGVRTVQRWEAQLGLPIHRPAGKDHSAVLAFSSELDQWLDSRPVRYPTISHPNQVPDAQTLQVHALLTRAEDMLQKIESLLVRADETQRRLAEALEEVAARERVDGGARGRGLEAGAA